MGLTVSRRASMTRAKGQALPEMIIVFPLVVILIMSILQIALIYRGKATLNNATFLAARAGSLNHGYLSNMESTFYDRMAALGQILPVMRNGTTTEGLYDNPGRINLLATQMAMRATHTYDPIEVIWPTQAVFNRFAVRFNELESCSGSSCPFSKFGGKFRLAKESVFQIPVENMDARNQTIQDIDGVDVDLQDASLLGIRSRYCYDMEVPVANFIIWRTLQVSQGASADWAACQALARLFGENRFMIPLTGRSVVRMQTGFRCENNETKGVDCENL